jgi:hypothetical protein
MRMVGPVRGVYTIFASAVTGIRTATDDFAKHAGAIAQKSVVDYQDRVHFSNAGRALAARSQTASAEAPPSLERSLVGEVVAKHDLAANVTSLRTADEVLKKLVRLGDR